MATKIRMRRTTQKIQGWFGVGNYLADCTTMLRGSYLGEGPFDDFANFICTYKYT